MRKAVAAVTVLGLVGAGVLVFLRLGVWLSSADPVRPVDVIVVPGGDPDRRLVAALDLVERGLADGVWVTTEPPGPVLRERDAVLDFARRRGAGELVEVIGASRSTPEDAGLVAARLLDRPDTTVRVGVVTSPWHQTRARITFRRTLGAHAELSVWGDGRPYDAARWWEEEPETTAVESLKLLGTLALFGARPVLPFEDVPRGLPVRALLGGFVVAVAAGVVCRPLARRLGLVAHPRLFRAHAYPVPLLGGLAVLTGLGGGVLAAGGFSVGPAGAVAVGGVVALALVGLADDLVGLGARSRLVWSAGAAAVAWLLGLRAQVFDPGGAGDLGNAFVTVLWFVGITHALNVLDNLDGAAAGVAAASAATVAVVGISSGQWVVTVGAAALCGACLGYLVHNVHPARLFMGDLGALAVGFALAAVGMGMRPQQQPPLSLAVAACALGVPIFDVVVVTISRLRSGRPVGLGGTDHTAHRLVVRGLSVRQASAVLWGAQAVLGVVAIAIANVGRPLGWGLAVTVAAVAVLALVVVLRMPPWKPPRDEDATANLRDAFGRAIEPLRDLLVHAERYGLTTSDPAAVHSLEDALGHVERRRRLLETD